MTTDKTRTKCVSISTVPVFLSFNIVLLVYRNLTIIFKLQRIIIKDTSLMCHPAQNPLSSLWAFLPRDCGGARPAAFKMEPFWMDVCWEVEKCSHLGEGRMSRWVFAAWLI